MSRKYVYFKISSIGSESFPRDAFSGLELQSLGDNLKCIQTIFQLTDIPDLKQVVLKDTPLQQLLSSHLPACGNHGYLWAGELLPASLESLLYQAALLDSVYILQRTTDPEPAILGSPLGALAQRFEIYNWFIFVLPSFHRLYEQALHLRCIRKETNWHPEVLAKNTLSAFDVVQRGDGGNPSYLLQPPGDGQLSLQVLSQALPKPLLLQSRAYQPDVFTALSDASYANMSAGYNIASDLSVMHPAAFRRESEALLASVRLLLSSRDQSQADLFSDPIDDDFRSVWQKEKDRLQALKSGLSENSLKAFVLTRFILARHSQGSRSTGGRLISLALEATLEHLLRRQSGQDFLTVLKNKLFQIEQDLQLTDVLRAYLRRSPQIAPDVPSIQQNCESMLVLPGDGYGRNPDKWELLRLRLLDRQAEILPDAGFDDQSIWHDEIGNQGMLYQESGDNGRNLFNRLYAQNFEREAVNLFWHWMQLRNLVQNVVPATAQLKSICFICPQVAVQERSYSIGDITKEYLQRIPTDFQIKQYIPNVPLDDNRQGNFILLERK